jgi:hypothetical protein
LRPRSVACQQEVVSIRKHVAYSEVTCDMLSSSIACSECRSLVIYGFVVVESIEVEAEGVMEGEKEARLRCGRMLLVVTSLLLDLDGVPGEQNMR